MIDTQTILANAKAVSLKKPLSSEEKNKAILRMADSLQENCEEILLANRIDVGNAKGKISPVMIDRLRLDTSRIDAMAEGMRQVALLPDPVGSVLETTTRNDGLVIEKTSVPFGVVAIIYESRPNVTSDAAALSFKSGNVCVLRSGKDAFFSAQAIVKALRTALAELSIDEDYVNLIEDTSRDSANALMTAVGFVDLLIPRGGKGLIKACTENAKVPCIETGTGICHIYIDKYADVSKALDIVNNAKRSRPSVCNAAEVCVVHKGIASEFLPQLYKKFYETEPKTELKGDSAVRAIIPVSEAQETDFDTEFLDYKMAVAVVENIDAAISHIAQHSTHHSDCIVTENEENAQLFCASVDSAAVYVNASTRFTDGGEFGLGCEMGISTQKLHARGPMGLRELNTYKYIIRGNGQIR